MKEALLRTWRELVEFVKNPTDAPDENQESQHVYGQLFRLIVLELPIMLGLILIIAGLDEFEIVNLDSHELEGLMESFSVPMILLLVVLFAPFFEELIFRFFLTFRRCYPYHILIHVAALFSSRDKQHVFERWEEAWNKNYKVIIYFSAIVFGMVHITNFEMTNEIILASPILIAPQVVIGFFLVFMRVRYGLLTSFYFHAIHNFIFIGIGLLFDPSGVGSLVL